MRRTHPADETFDSSSGSQGGRKPVWPGQAKTTTLRYNSAVEPSPLRDAVLVYSAITGTLAVLISLRALRRDRAAIHLRIWQPDDAQLWTEPGLTYYVVDVLNTGRRPASVIGMRAETFDDFLRVRYLRPSHFVDYSDQKAAVIRIETDFLPPLVVEEGSKQTYMFEIPKDRHLDKVIMLSGDNEISTISAPDGAALRFKYWIARAKGTMKRKLPPSLRPWHEKYLLLYLPRRNAAFKYHFWFIFSLLGLVGGLPGMMLDNRIPFADRVGSLAFGLVVWGTVAAYCYRRARIADDE